MASRSSEETARINELIRRCEQEGGKIPVVVALKAGITDPLKALHEIAAAADSGAAGAKPQIEAELASKYAPYLRLKADLHLLRLLGASHDVVSILAADEPAFIAPVKRRDA